MAATALVQAVCTILNDPMIGQRMEDGTASVAPFANVAVHLPASLRKEYTRQLCERVMADLSQKRAKGTPRVHVFALAEVFARLVELGELPIAGAVHSIVRLLRNPEKRMAAVTMLGKTVEVCFSSLTERCDRSAMDSLRDELANMTDPEYAYDVSYVYESLGGLLGWGVQPTMKPAAAAQPPPQQPQPQQPPQPQPQPAQQQRVAVQTPAPVAAHAARAVGGGAAPGTLMLGLDTAWTQSCRPGTIFAMAVDTERQTVVTAVNHPSCPDVAQVWRAPGAAGDNGFVGEFSLGSNIRGLDMVTVLDIVRPGVMLAASMPRNKASGDHCNVRLYTPAPENASGWQDAGVLVRPDAKPLVALRWLSDYSFAVGERDLSRADGRRDIINVFKLTQEVAFNQLVPLLTLSGHSNMITALESCDTMPSCILSASMDKTIRLWDRNAPGGTTGTLIGMMSAPGLLAHVEMVNTLSCRGHALCSGSVDGTVALWDLRIVGRGPAGVTGRAATWLEAAAGAPPNPVVKVAMGGPAAGCAAATSKGPVFSLDTSLGGAAPRCAPTWAHTVPNGRYHGLVWDREANLLYGGYTAGPDAPAHVDVWRARP